MLWCINLIDTILEKTIGLSIVHGWAGDQANSLEDFSKCAHKMRVLYNAFPATFTTPQPKHYLLCHQKYGDPLEMIANDPSVSLVDFGGGHAVFAQVPEGFDVYDSKESGSTEKHLIDTSLSLELLPR